MIVALAVATGDDEGANQTLGDANIPPFETTNPAEAARAAGCRLESPRELPGQHTTEPVTYESATPTSGDHAPTAAQDGIYGAGNAPKTEESIHALEHGRIAVQYRKGTPAETTNRLEALAAFEVKGEPGYKLLVFENQLGMKAAVAATAWNQALTCPTMNERVFDALRAFWRTNVDKAPENVPFAP